MDKKEEPEVNGLPEKEKEKEDDTPTVDIMAQQLKFVACLKILMEELSTLATGFEVDGKFSVHPNIYITKNVDNRKNGTARWQSLRFDLGCYYVGIKPTIMFITRDPVFQTQ